MTVQQRLFSRQNSQSKERRHQRRLPVSDWRQAVLPDCRSFLTTGTRQCGRMATRCLLRGFCGCQRQVPVECQNPVISKSAHRRYISAAGQPRRLVFARIIKDIFRSSAAEDLVLIMMIRLSQSWYASSLSCVTSMERP